MPTLLTAGAETNRYVYTYSYPDGTPYYVGKGTGPRIREHYRNARKDEKAKTFVVKVTKGILASGQEPIIRKIVDSVDDEFSLFVEQEFIRKHGRRDIGTGILANCTDGGDGVFGVAPETKERMLSNLQNGAAYRFKKGQSPHNIGKPASQEAIEKMRRTKVGKKASEETRQKMREWQQANNKRRGVPHSEDAKRRISESKRGCSAPPATFLKWTCTCCGKVGVSVGAAKRWHFENCKFKEMK